MPDSVGIRPEFANDPSPATSGLDVVISITKFPNAGASSKEERRLPLRAIIGALRDTRADAKAALPWLKLASFGEQRTVRNSLRHDANVLSIHGVEGDYDGEQITLERARQIIAQAGIAAILYTSPSHTPEAPRWRVLCPTSEPLPPAERARLLARLNGLFVGALSRESWTLSQSYYYGAVGEAPHHAVVAIDGRPINLAHELDAQAIGKPEPPKPDPATYNYQPRPLSDGSATRYGRQALENECNAIANAVDGGKHYAVNKAAYSIGGLVSAGEIDEGFAFGSLSDALATIRGRCEDFAAAERTLRKAFEDGKAARRAKPEPAARGFDPATSRLFGGFPPGSFEDDDAPSESISGSSAPGAAPAFPATPFNPLELGDLAPRRWVYGHFLIERFLSVLGAPGGTGKTAYAISVSLSVALGRPLLGEAVHMPGNVWLYNLEDPRDEILRRIYAGCLHHQINPADLEGRLFLDSGRDRALVVAERTKDGDIVATPLVEPLVAELKARGIRLLVVDPFVKSHRLEENRNEQIDFAATLWNRVAELANCAILLVHHFRKGGMAGDADAFRGASALVDAARAAVALSVMSEKDADRLGLEPDERRFHIRADNAKLNLAPPPSEAVWLRLESVDLPNGDKVQAARRWDPPSPWGNLPMKMIVQTLDAIAAGRPNGDLWSPRKEAKDGWVGRVVVDMTAVTEGQALEIVRQWLDTNLLTVEEFKNADRQMRKGIKVDPAKVQQMRQQVYGSGGASDE